MNKAVVVVNAGILQSQLSKGSLSQSDVKATVCGLKEVDLHFQSIFLTSKSLMIDHFQIQFVNMC